MTVCDKFNLPNLDPRVVQKQHNTFDFVQYDPRHRLATVPLPNGAEYPATAGAVAGCPVWQIRVWVWWEFKFS